MQEGPDPARASQRQKALLPNSSHLCAPTEAAQGSCGAR